MLIVTGADARYFAMVGLLARSLERWMPELDLRTGFRVCDFGLTPAQRRFLEGTGWLLPRPATVPEGTHPYLAKAALADYLAGQPEEFLAWIDGDMMAAGPLGQPLRALLDVMARGGAALAACPDAGAPDIAGCLARWGAGVAPFGAAAEAAGIDPRRPYLNSGFFLCTDRTALEAVRDRCAALEDHRMIDQNAFNLVAWGSGRRCGVLDAAVWNVHGDLLGRVSARGDGVACDGRRVLLAHATSVGGAHHEERHGVLRGPSGDLPIGMKVFRNPALAAMQGECLNGFAAGHRAALVAAGCYG